MPRVPSPVTSPPEVPGQPYDALAPGTLDAQSTPAQVYDAAGGKGSAEAWPKIRQGGSIDMTTGVANPHDWPGDGSSDGRDWKQT